MTPVHEAPVPGTRHTPCCRETPAVLTARDPDTAFTTDRSMVTCDPLGRALGEVPSLRAPRPAWTPPPVEVLPERRFYPLTEESAARCRAGLRLLARLATPSEAEAIAADLATLEDA